MKGHHHCLAVVVALIAFNSKLHVAAEFSVVPLWNNTEATSSESCLLTTGNVSGQNTTTLTGNSNAVCNVQLISSPGTGTLIYIPHEKPHDAFVYVENFGNPLDCQNRYEVIATDESCFIELSHTELRLYLKGHASAVIRNTPMNQSLCPSQHDNETLKENGSATYEIKHCSTKGFNHTITCTQFSDHICSFHFSQNCNAILGNRFVELTCYNNLQSSHTAHLIIYPVYILTLDLSEQNIPEISVNTFINLVHLEELDISYSRLSRLHPQAFVGLKSLRTLHLRGNELEILDGQTFDGLDDLTKLYLDYNNIIVFPIGIFKGLTSLEKLYLRGNKLGSLEEGLFNETSKIIYLSLGDNSQTHLPSRLFRGLSHLETLHLTSNHITSLFWGLFNETIELVYLSLSNNNLVILPRGLFKGLRNLETLYLRSNQILSLDEDLFNETENVDYLSLRDNNLTSLPRGLFKGLQNLEKLYLYGNQIRSLDSGQFNETGKLVILNLKYNLLTSLPKGLFKGLTRLKTLHLRGNQIISLDGDLFEDTSNLATLYLYENNLTALPRGLLKGLINLKILHLRTNQIVSLDGDLFNETSKLTYLTLRDNMLSFLPQQLFKGLLKLTELYLYGNQLTSLDSTLFQELPSLEVLKLHTNMFQSMKFDLFWMLKALFYLDLGKNQISRLNNQMFSGLSRLEILYLNYNQLRALDEHLFIDTINLRVLELSGNQLSNMPSIENLAELAFVGLLENELTLINRNTFIGLPKQTEIVVNQTEICECYVPSGIDCEATNIRSPYLTCDRLLSDRMLMVFMWLIGLNAVGGNMFVLSRKKSKNEKGKVQTFLLCNLALSDLLMGIYMLIIASADIYFGDYFPMHAETWRSGVTCRIAGAISIISTEASVFFITLISIDRFINIRFPYSRRKIRKRSSAIIVALLWIISLVLGTVPSVLAGGNGKFYDNSHVCIGLPLAQIERFSKDVSMATIYLDNTKSWYYKYMVKSHSFGHVPGLYFATALFLGLNGICYFVILVCYVEIVRFVLKSSKRAGLNKDMKEQIRMTAKVAAIVVTDFFCWAPIIVLGILVQTGAATLPSKVFAWSVTIILPINSAINPYLYTIAGIISDRRKRAQISPATETARGSSRRHTSVTKDTELHHFSPRPGRMNVQVQDRPREMMTNESTALAESEI